MYPIYYMFQCCIFPSDNVFQCLRALLSMVLIAVGPSVVYPNACDSWCLCVVESVNVLVFSSVQFSCTVVSNSLWPHEPQHTTPPCPSPTPGVHSNSHPSSRWCHPAISSSVVPFSSCPRSLPASESLPMSQLFAWGGQSTRVSALASVLPKNTQDWSPLGWTGWMSL